MKNATWFLKNNFWILYKGLYTFPMYWYIGKVYKPLYKIQKKLKPKLHFSF